MVEIGGSLGLGLSWPGLLRRGVGDAGAFAARILGGRTGEPHAHGRRLHPPVSRRRSQPPRHVGHEARAPAEIRGEFKPIATKMPGIQVCEHLPRFSHSFTSGR